jgi:hypothetical protein
MLLLLLLVWVDSAWAAAPECLQDADCVPAACCQSSICTNLIVAERGCGKKECSEACAPFTLDCGGKCECTTEKRCAAILGHGGGPPERRPKTPLKVKTVKRG